MIIKSCFHLIELFILFNILNSNLIKNSIYYTINLLCTSYFYSVGIIITIERSLATIQVKTYEKEKKPLFGIFLTIIIVYYFCIFTLKYKSVKTSFVTKVI